VTAALLAEPRPRPWLAPLGALFGGASALRAALYRRGLFARARLGSPVISIGNLAVGGRGKTPLVERTAAVLRDAGRAVAVLSRGYGGAFRGDMLVVSDGTRMLAAAPEAGDEPVMLAAALPGVVVAVGRDRATVGRAVESRFGPCVHVLDDGFQHLRLHRDLDVVCVDAGDLRDRLLPAGSLREGPGALSRADVVAVSAERDDDAESACAVLRARLGAERVLRVRRASAGFTDLAGAAVEPPRRVFLLTGIARPERVVADIEGLGIAVAGRATFADHHRFGADELEAAGRRASAEAVDAIVTTAKDAQRLPPVAAPVPILVARIRCVIDDEDRFRARLLAVAGPARPA
jgi:tetraacyldisaccharide 4'-kinase